MPLTGGNFISNYPLVLFPLHRLDRMNVSRAAALLYAVVSAGERAIWAPVALLLLASSVVVDIEGVARDVRRR